MARFPSLGTVFSNSGASMPTGYSGTGLGTAYPYGAASKARYVAKIVVNAASSMTAVTMKLQGYDDVPNGPCDFVSVRDDNGTSELEHAFTVSANNTYYFSFNADPRGFEKIRLVCKVTGTSHASDSISVSAVAF